jgi:hypothetical protein
LWLKVLELPKGMTKFADVYACVRVYVRYIGLIHTQLTKYINTSKSKEKL